jgi:dihydrofolate synthase/folylpolyglutamate synthase
MNSGNADHTQGFIDAHQRCADALAAFPRMGAGIGLHRVAHLLKESGHDAWLSTHDAIKVTGSKGKGSTSVATASILRELGTSMGFSTGLFTSPHLFTPVERIKIDGMDIAPEQLTMLLDRVRSRADAHEAKHPGDLAGGFEALTVAAVEHMANAQVRASVWEVGIGGRYDPVRLIPGTTTILTSVELEHTALLGTTREAIAYDKADLCPSGGTLFCGRLGEDLLRRLRAYAGVRQFTLVEGEQQAQIRSLEYRDGWTRFDLVVGGVEIAGIKSPLHGEHQARNISLAVLAVMHWLERWPAAERPAREQFITAVRAGIEKIHWPGRLERIESDPPVFIDIAHTPASVAAVLSTLRAMHGTRPLIGVLGVSAGKDAPGIAEVVARDADGVVCTQAMHNGLDAVALASHAGPHARTECLHIEPEAPRAVELAIKLARARNGIVIVLGSMYLAVETKEHRAGRGPGSMRFF